MHLKRSVVPRNAIVNIIKSDIKSSLLAAFNLYQANNVNVQNEINIPTQTYTGHKY